MTNSSTEPRSLLLSVRQQLGRLLPLLLAVYVPMGLIFIILAFQDRIPVSTLLNDTTYEGGVPFYTGMLSTLGALIWTAAGAICGFTYLALRNQLNPSVRQFLLASSLLTIFLALDDLFLLHDEFLPEYIGIPELVVFAILILIVAGYIFAYRKVIQRSDYVLLLLAGACFAVSLIIDNIPVLLPGVYEAVGEATGNPITVVDGVQQAATGITSNIRYLLEDGVKLLGIIAWSLYFMRYCIAQTRNSLQFS